MPVIRHLKVVGPANVKRTVGLPVRKPNAVYRSREHLTEHEVERLVEAAKDNRWGHRDSTMVLLAFRHGLRVAELVDLRWGRWTSNTPSCTSAGSSRVLPPRIR
jgi:integrase